MPLHSDPAAILDLDVATLLPPSLAAYGPLISDGLVYFLERLSAPRLHDIVTAQLALPATASDAERLVTLFHHCPTLHKLGQMVARDRRLPMALRTRLQSLESLPPSSSVSALRPAIEAELGPVPGLRLAPAALAEGSVAVVVPFSWRRTSSGGTEQGVIKILKPGVAERLHEELEIWPDLGAFLEQRCAELDLPALDYRDTLESIRALLLHEVRLDLEQAHMRAAADRYADFAEVHVPRLLPFGSPRLTAMERIDGVKVTMAAQMPPVPRLQVAEVLVRALLAEPFWASQAAVFHADPHAGNLLLTAERRVAILDWSLTTEIGLPQRQALVRLVLAALAQDEAAACHAVRALARTPPFEPALRAAVGEALHHVRQGQFPGVDWAMDLLDKLAVGARAGFPENLLLFRKMLLTLSGVLADVESRLRIDRILARSALARLAGEFAHFPAAAMQEGSFGPHIFAPDLFALWMTWPATAVRYWQGQWRDWLAPRTGLASY